MAPLLSSLSHQILPPIASVYFFAIDNPRPIDDSPSVGLALNGSNSLNILVISFSLIPGPLSAKMIGPVVEELASEYDGKAVIGKVDVDANPEVSAKFGIRSIPTLLVFKNGEIVVSYFYRF